MRRLITILAIILPFLLANASEVINFTIEQGLSNMDVSCVCQDRHFTWIATADGLNRFDGKNFKVYRCEAGNPKSIAENNIETLLVDSNGYLWIGLKTKGVDIYDPIRDEFIHLGQIVDISPHRAICIYEDSKKNIWIGCWDEGLYQLSPNGNGELGYDVKRHYETNTVSSIVEKPFGKLWIGTYKGFFLYDTESCKNILASDKGYSITQMIDAGEHNSLYFTSWDSGLCKIQWNDSYDLVVKTLGDSSLLDAYRLCKLAESQLLIGTWGNGIKTFDIKSGQFKDYGDVDVSVALSLFRGNNGNMWIGTYGSGLFCVSEVERGIWQIPIDGKNTPLKVVNSSGDGRLLLGFQGDGLYSVDLSNRRLVPERIGNTDHSFNDYILSIYKDDDVIIVGNDENYFCYAKNDNINSSSHFVWSVYSEPDGQFGKVTCIMRDGDSVFWVGTKQSGLFSLGYNKNDGTFNSARNVASMGLDEITGIISLGLNQICVSSHSGLYKIDLSERASETIFNIFGGTVYGMIQDHSRKCLWLCTSDGLYSFGYSNGTYADNNIRKIDSAKGAVRCAALDRYNNLWFASAGNIYCLMSGLDEAKELNMGGFKESDYVTCSNFDYGGRGGVAFGGSNKLLLIDAEKAFNNEGEHNVLLSSVSIEHQKVDVGEDVHGIVTIDAAPEYAKSINLSYLCKWISLSFCETGWGNFRNAYQYKIEGFSEEWRPLDIDKPLTFSQLPPGSYRLIIRESKLGNVDDNVKNALELEVKVIPPWWKSSLFYALCVIALLLLVISSYIVAKRIELKRQADKLLEFEKSKKEEVVREKESFITGLSHDLLTSFSLIKAPVCDLKRDASLGIDQREKLDVISKNADFLSEMFTTLLDFKKVEMSDSHHDVRQVEIVEYTRFIVNAFDYLAKSKAIDLRFNPEIERLELLIDSIKYERILYNLISNAVKFTGELGNVTVSLKCDVNNRKLSVCVSDSGIGIAKSNLDKIFEKFYREERCQNVSGLGVGLYTARKFLEIMGGSISIDSVEGEGTSFTVNLPFDLPEIMEMSSRPSDEPLFNVLVVEDNSQLREYLRKRLSEHFDVAIASDGKEALDYIKTNLPEIVISDIMMDNMDGLELCSTIKGSPLYSDIFVILLSAKSGAEDEMVGYKAGADFYITKPFDPEILINHLKNVYATRQRRRKQIISELSDDNSDGLRHKNSENDFLNKAMSVVDKHIGNEEFRVDDFASEMGLSSVVLNRKFKMIIGETPSVFIRNHRLRKAAMMLKTTDLSVSEIAYLVGFSQAHYFIKCFKELYGDTPKNYRNEQDGQAVN